MENALIIATLQFLSHLNPTLLALVLVLGIATPAGVVTVILVLWSSFQKRQSQLVETYRIDINKVVGIYHEDVLRTTRFYEENVKLVEAYQDLARDLKSVIIMNTQTMTRLCDKVEGNQYCPSVRLRKESPGRID